MTTEQFESSNYPTEIDSDQNLFLVHDSLRVVLAENYDPNDSVLANRTKITVSGDISRFPDTGIITLTEQYSEVEDRAISFYYTSKTTNTFEGLIALPGFDNDTVKTKGLTNVTQNVMAEHHNAIKNAVIAVETFVGVKGTIDTVPFGDTMEGRINFLRKLVLTPRAWFTADKHVGLVPLTVTFKNESFRLGDGEVIFTWDFGDQSSNISVVSLISTISATSNVPLSITDVSVVDTDGGTISKTYTSPNKYTVSLKVENQYGTDVVEFEDFITARIEAPIEAVIAFTASTSQTTIAGLPSGGPFDPETPPTIRSRTNKFINMSIPSGINPSTLRTYAGEEVVGSTPIDPIETYTWSLTDDLTHANSTSTRASYSVGGLYDLILRCDTSYGAYRITTYKDCIDIIEQRNLWLFTESSNTAYGNEFGLISETFKSGDVPYTILRDSAFLTGSNNEEQALREFNKNTGFAINGTIGSGDNGIAILAYSSGGGSGSPLSSQSVRLAEFEGFGGTFSNSAITITRPWNWIFLPFSQKAYFLFGADPDATAGQNLSNQIKDTLTLGGLSLDAPTTLTGVNYLNGANELVNHVTSSYSAGEPLNGRFAVYRSAVKDSTGYFLRNDGVGTFFKIKSFYRTEGVSDDPVVNIRKLQDIAGDVKTEGELVGLSNGVFFFNNSGNISAFNTVNGVWETGSSSSPFSMYQDTSVDDFSDTSNTLLAASDGDRNAYLSYDYSTSAFIKYNSVDQTFFGLNPRISGNQWIMGIY
ncbi:MAG: PKD domain-containing protein [Crenarchaeota archaeon]|nr:MAG: PKD domain-containing protein [Thermoproteota archaeon]